ncbi:MAG: inorganic diphosphatase [Endozoicomonadaceae bacterium]|nr:inorganic diphosphatase [Endozoicomonadaceae bacterium]MBE8232569.1 inorganic diphosphatase [Endozoicomonadaceae bacterium]
MSFQNITAGQKLPHDIHVVIEISAHANPVKYEVDKILDALTVDRFMAASMFYPANYGYIPQTLSEDGDPIDVLVITPYPIAPGAVIRSRPIGVLNMEDEKGKDEKIIAVPHHDLTTQYHDIHDITDISQLLRDQIMHFFEHYKKIEANKWVKIGQWGIAQEAHQLIIAADQAYQAKKMVSK